MIYTREGLAQALFQVLQEVPGLVTCSRFLKGLQEVPDADQPALFLTLGGFTPIQDPSGAPTRWKHEYLVYVLATSKDPLTPPSAVLNNIIDAVEAALKPQVNGPPGFPGTVQVLGDSTGRIRHCWISGPIYADEGVLGDQTFAAIPIEIEIV